MKTIGGFLYKYRNWRRDQKQKNKERKMREKCRIAISVLGEIEITMKELGYSRKFRKTLWMDFVRTEDKGGFIKSLIGDEKI